MRLMEEPYFSEEHNYGNAFWIQPVVLKPLQDFRIRIDDVIETDDEISIPAIFVDSLLLPLFLKHFDANMMRNAVRVGYERDNQIEYVRGFDYNLTNNFYTYECMHGLLKKISEYSKALEIGDMDIIDKQTRIGIEKLHSDYSDIEEENYYRIIATFYDNLVIRLQKMINDHPETDMISIMGP